MRNNFTQARLLWEKKSIYILQLYIQKWDFICNLVLKKISWEENIFMSAKSKSRPYN